MKKFMKLLFAGVLISGLCAGFTACDKPDLKNSEPDPRADVVFIKTTPNEETILLAKSGIPWGDESIALRANFELEYGKGNVRTTGGIPVEENFSVGKDYYEYDVDVDPGAVANCYELTMTIDFADVGIPSREELFSSEFCVGRINGTVATCKTYFWAFTEEGAETYLSYREQSYDERSSRYRLGLYEPEALPWGGIIIGTSIKNLGPEVQNMPIEF